MVVVEELFRAGVFVPEPGCSSELLVLGYLVLQGVGHVALSFQKDAPDRFVLRVTL
jgi:hypothetical protein